MSIIIGSSLDFVWQFISALSNRFSIKDLGLLNNFLGVVAVPTSFGLFLSQYKYVRDLLDRAKMDSAKEVSSPMSTSSTLKLNDGSPLVDATLYRSTLGALQLLSLTRPDISFAVTKLSQFIHWPSSNYWTAVKQLLYYPKGTLKFKLRSSNLQRLSIKSSCFC